MDANEDVRSGVISRMTNRYHMDKRITRTQDGPPPATHNRGTKTIDAIYASKTLYTSKGGYLPFDTSPGNYRSLWWDVAQASIFRKYNHPPEIRAPRRLQSRFPKTVAKYHRHLEALSTKHSLREPLKSTTAYPATSEVRKEYEIANVLRRRKASAENEDGSDSFFSRI